MEDNTAIVIDDAYEFSAPTYYDFIIGETDVDVHNAELWFDTALSHAPSPFMLRIKAGRSVQLSSQCDFGIVVPKAEEGPCASKDLSLKPEQSASPIEIKNDSDPNKGSGECRDAVTHQVSDKQTGESPCEQLCKEAISVAKAPGLKTEAVNSSKKSDSSSSQDVSTPKPTNLSGKGEKALNASKKQQTAKKIAAALKNLSAMKSKIESHLSRSKTTVKPTATRSFNSGTPTLAQENQAIKRQKLEDGKTRQILSIKLPSLPHKARAGVAINASKLSSSTVAPSKDNRKMYVREPVAPYVSMAEMMKKFQASTRDMALPQTALSQDGGQGQPKLTLTRPKEPDFVTSQRVRMVKVKSSEELEAEMMAKMPKFKARPLNRKILEAPSLPPLPKSLPQKPEFQEFHLETTERANKNLDASSVVSTACAQQKAQWKPNYLTEPKTPVLQTSLRARPINVKSSLEIEQEELDKIPKFKARPLNKKIFESKGELGLFCNTKKQVTVPKEFVFAIDERIPPPSTSVADLFDKLSLYSEPTYEKPLPRITKPSPFNLHTEGRGAEKERRLITELVQKQTEEERARVPKAKPYPYTTDYPVVPPKPEPKECTRPEPFQLESLVRHEEEMKRELEERQRKEQEEAQMRIFRAQPVLKEDPIPLPEKERKPLTDIQEFNLHVEHRAVDRAEFDKKIKEKELLYKRYREEAEAEKQVEEEKALKQLRRTLVPHARPVPKFANPFIPQNRSCKEPTKAKSPKLRVLRRKERRAAAGSDIQPVFSAAASLMR